MKDNSPNISITLTDNRLYGSRRDCTLLIGAYYIGDRSLPTWQSIIGLLVLTHLTTFVLATIFSSYEVIKEQLK